MNNVSVNIKDKVIDKATSKFHGEVWDGVLMWVRINGHHVRFSIYTQAHEQCNRKTSL